MWKKDGERPHVSVFIMKIGHFKEQWYTADQATAESLRLIWYICSLQIVSYVQQHKSDKPKQKISLNTLTSIKLKP